MTPSDLSDLISRIQAASSIDVGGIQITAVTALRCAVWGGTRGRSMQEMIAEIVTDRAANTDNVAEAIRGANLQAAIVQSSTANWIRAVIRQNGIEVPGVDLLALEDELLLSIFGVGDVDLTQIDPDILAALDE